MSKSEAKYNSLTDKQKAAMWKLCATHAEDWAQRRVPAREVCEFLEQQLGFKVTSNNLQKAIEVGAMPRYKGLSPRVGGSSYRTQKLEVQVAQLKVQVDAQQATIDKLREDLEAIAAVVSAPTQSNPIPSFNGKHP